jgi:hypothetical protein
VKKTIEICKQKKRLLILRVMMIVSKLMRIFNRSLAALGKATELMALILDYKKT